MSTMKCRVRKSGEGYEGTVTVNGLKPTKLVKKDDTSVFANKSGVASAAKAVASRLGLQLEVDDTTSKSTSKGGSKKTTTNTTELVPSDTSTIM